jgi:hypothetical protein
MRSSALAAIAQVAIVSLELHSISAQPVDGAIYLPPGQNGDKTGVWGCPDAVLGVDTSASNHDGDLIQEWDVQNVCVDGARCCYRKHCPDGICTTYCLYRPHDTGFQFDLPTWPAWATENGKHCPPYEGSALWYPRGVTGVQAAPPAPEPQQQPQPAPVVDNPAPPQPQPELPAVMPPVDGAIYLPAGQDGDKTGVWGCPDAVLGVDTSASNHDGDLIQEWDVQNVCVDGARCCYRKHCPDGICTTYCLYRPHDTGFQFDLPTWPEWATENGKHCPPYEGSALWYPRGVTGTLPGPPAQAAGAAPPQPEPQQQQAPVVDNAAPPQPTVAMSAIDGAIYLPPGQDGDKTGVWGCPDAVLGVDTHASNHDGDLIEEWDVQNVCVDGARCCYRKHCPDGICTTYCLYRPHDTGFEFDLPTWPEWATENGKHCPPYEGSALWYPRGVTDELVAEAAPAVPQPHTPPAQPQVPGENPEIHGDISVEHQQADLSGASGPPLENWLSPEERGNKAGVWDCPDAVSAVDAVGSNHDQMIAGGDVPSTCVDGSRCCYRRHCPGGVCSLFCLYRPSDPAHTGPHPMPVHPSWATEDGKSCPPYSEGAELWYVQSVQNAPAGEAAVKVPDMAPVAEMVPPSEDLAEEGMVYVGCSSGLDIWIRKAEGNTCST